MDDLDIAIHVTITIIDRDEIIRGQVVASYLPLQHFHVGQLFAFHHPNL